MATWSMCLTLIIAGARRSPHLIATGAPGRKRKEGAALEPGTWTPYDPPVTLDTLRAACGQLLSVGFDGPGAPAELLGRIARSQVGGVMLFRPNVVDPAQVAGLVRTLREASPAAPLVVSADQEGGLVQR